MPIPWWRPDSTPLVASSWFGFFSLCCMLTATVCVYKIGRHLFNENVALLASLVFALAGSVQFIGKLATYDAPCLVLVALATTLAVTKRSIAIAPIIGVLLAAASVTSTQAWPWCPSCCS